MPVSIRIVLESGLRNFDGGKRGGEPKGRGRSGWGGGVDAWGRGQGLEVGERERRRGSQRMAKLMFCGPSL